MQESLGPSPKYCPRPLSNITTWKFNKLTSEMFAAILKQANLAGKNDIADFIKKHFNNKFKNLNS